MSYHNHSEQAKVCLIAGHLSEMRFWLRRAESLAASEDEAQDIRCQALRYCLLTGQYEQSENIRQDIERLWPEIPRVVALHEALFAVAGWGPLPADDGRPDLFGLIQRLVCDEPLAPERALKSLGDWSRLWPCHPLWLTDLAAQPFPEETFALIGERVLPPNVEVALAELWYGQGGIGEYPRRALLEEVASEPAFAFLPIYLDVLSSLQQENIQAALAAYDQFFSEETAWLWLRAVDLVRHFGTPEIMARMPRRLRIARRELNSLALGEYLPLVSAFTHTVSCCLSAVPKPFTAVVGEPNEETPSLGEKVKVLEELFALSGSVLAAPWSAAPGACLMVERLLRSSRKKDLSVAPAFPDLRALHGFVQDAGEFVPEAAAGWLVLPPVWHAEKNLWPILIEVLLAASEETALACVQVLREQGMALALLWEALPAEAQATLFVAEPEPYGLKAVGSLPDEILGRDWAGLVTAALTLGGQKLGKAERAAQETLLGRLAACFDRPHPPHLPKDVLSRLADQASARPASNDLEQAFWCRLGLRLAEDQNWEASFRVLAQAGDAGAALRGEITARHWLATGQKEAYQPQRWQEASGPWSEMAWAWDTMLELCPASVSETSPLRYEHPELTTALDALAEWQQGCLSSDTLLPFTETSAFDALIEHWRFLKSLRSWRLLTSTADVLPPIAGVTPKPDRPLLSLLHLVRHGADAEALRMVLATFLSWDLPPALSLRLLDMASSPEVASAELNADLRGWMRPEILDNLRCSLTSEQLVRLDALVKKLPLALASPEAKTILHLNQSKSSEKKIRLALQKVKTDDLTLEGVWEQMGQFLTGPHFCRWSLPQWDLIRKWRRLMHSQDSHSWAQFAETVPEQYLQILSSVLFDALRPVIIDGSNVLRDKKTKQQSEWATDCLEKLWESLSHQRYYPIITYVDRNEFAKQEEEHGPEARFHLNKMIEEGLIEDGATSKDTGKIADEYILRHIERENWQESVMIITNDDYAKPRRKATDIYLPQLFPWLTKTTFSGMQAKFGYDDGQWVLRQPDGKEFPF